MRSLAVDEVSTNVATPVFTGQHLSVSLDVTMKNGSHGSISSTLMAVTHQMHLTAYKRARLSQEQVVLMYPRLAHIYEEKRDAWIKELVRALDSADLTKRVAAFDLANWLANMTSMTRSEIWASLYQIDSSLYYTIDWKRLEQDTK